MFGLRFAYSLGSDARDRTEDIDRIVAIDVSELDVRIGTDEGGMGCKRSPAVADRFIEVLSERLNESLRVRELAERDAAGEEEVDVVLMC